MGFTSGDRGLKRTVINLCNGGVPHSSDALYRAPSLESGLLEMPDEVTRNCTSIIKDGTVMFMGIPQDVGSISEYVEVVTSTLFHAFGLARLVWLCIDDPSQIPVEKTPTQKRRSRNEPMGPGDDWDVEYVELLSNCHSLVTNRTSRYRLIDEVMRRVLPKMSEFFKTSCDGSMLIVDSIDMRGASRPLGEERRPARLYVDTANVEPHADDEFESCIRRMIHRDELSEQDVLQLKLGEADLKIRIAEDVLAERALKREILLVLIDTIDTDQLPISLLAAAERRERRRAAQEAAEENREENRESKPHPPGQALPVVLLCMRERGKWAAQELEAYRSCMSGASPFAPPSLKEASPFSNAGVLLINVDACLRSLDCLILREDIDRRSQVGWLRLLVASWALSGCDYVNSIGHCDNLTDAFMRTASAHSRRNHSLADLDWASANLPMSERVRRLSLAKEFLMAVIDDNERHKKAGSRQTRDPNCLEVAADSALWVAGYWSIRTSPEDAVESYLWSAAGASGANG